MATDANVLVGSSPTSDKLAGLTPEQLSNWKNTGAFPGDKSAKESKQAKEPEPTNAEDTATSKEASAAETAKPSPDSDPDHKQQEPHKKGKGVKERNSELDAEITELQNKLKTRRELRQQLTEADKDQGAKKAAPPAAAVKETPEQKQAAQTLKDKVSDKIKEIKSRADKYDSYEDMVADISDAFAQAIADDVLPVKLQEALDKFKGELKAEQKKESEESEVQKKNREIEQSFKERVAQSIEKHDDFVAVAFDKDLPVKEGSAVDQYILRSEVGTEILYFLGKNRDELTRINGLDPFDQMRELRDIETKLSGDSPAANKVTRAPKPVSEVAAKTTVPGDEADQALRNGDFQSYMKNKNAKEVAARKG
jgi:hypothetical protein